jgi:phospholipid/cholesterol/gamma-HCH transport system substrate-binding protein
METSAPSLGKIVSMVLFALSCIGLLLFLWIEFGGTIPFKAQGYRFKVAFPYAQELASPAQVRIAGVNVGKVVGTQLQGNRTLATIELGNQYAPIPRDTHAILRTKTILGETYVQLSEGSRKDGMLPDGGTIPSGNVVPAVQLDQIFSALNTPTRLAFQQWQQGMAQAIKGNDQNLNFVLGNLPRFAADSSDILKVLNIQHAAVVSLFHNGSTVFNALSHNQTALRSLITTGEQVFATTAANNRAIAATFRVFPTFLFETKLTMRRLQSFALNTDPLIRALEPVALNLGPTMHAVQVLSPYLKSLFIHLRPLIQASKTGLPAIAKVLYGARPVLNNLGPFLEQLNPILVWLGLHQHLIADFISQPGTPLEATTTAVGGNGHYLRTMSPLGPDTISLAGFSNGRTKDNRGNTYPWPLWLPSGLPEDFIKGDLPAWDCNNTGGDNSAHLGNPSCWVQPFPGHLLGQSREFPHITQSHYSSR